MRIFRNWRVRWGWAGTGQAEGVAAVESQPDIASGGPRASRAIPLADALTGQQLVLAEINDHRRLQHRLAELGLRPGVRIKIISRGRPGPFIIAIGDTRLVLGQQMARTVKVFSL